MKDHYQALGIPRSATGQEIQKAFRQLAFRYHPDVSRSHETAVKFMELKASYEILVDGWQKEIYDEALQEYEAVLYDRRSSSLRSSRKRSISKHPLFQPTKRGIHEAEHFDLKEPLGHDADIETELEVDLEESLHKSTYRLDLYNNPLNPELPSQFTVLLPGKLYHGDTLRVAKLGMIRDDRSRGNLWIHVKFRKHPHFRLQGSNIYHDIVIHSWDAALGATMDVATLEGWEKVNLAPNFFSQSTLRLLGRGLYRKNGTRGDLCINMRVDIDPPISRRARRLWLELEKEYNNQRQGIWAHSTTPRL